jgi:hypothetical protein
MTCGEAEEPEWLRVWLGSRSMGEGLKGVGSGGILGVCVVTGDNDA